MTTKHTLICSLYQDKTISFRSCTLSSKPSIDKLRDIYAHNFKAFSYVLAYCQKHHIRSLRVLSGLFPLSTHPSYETSCAPLVEEWLPQYGALDYSGVELSAHPDQFILLSSVNPHINEASCRELETYAAQRPYISWNLVNIHVGSKAKGLEEHSKILEQSVKQLSHQAKTLLSIENDEKSYSFLETLHLALANGLMMVPDFHHERCMQRRMDEKTTNASSDAVIYKHLEEVVDTYSGREATPLFHISSPSNGWSGIFKEHCQHAEYIAWEDYPHELAKHMGSREYRLDIEAKAKEMAIAQLEQRLRRE